MRKLSDKYRVAIIGLGRIGAQLESDPYREKPCTHLGAWLAHPKCEVVGIADIDKDRTEDILRTNPELKTKFMDGSLVAFEDYQKMLTEVKADIVSIATPDPTHKAIARNAMGYQNIKLIFLEKPIAATLSDADDIISRARSFKIKVAINHTRRWDPVWQHAAKLCTEDPPESMLCKFGGDPIREGVHMADLIHWFAPKNKIVTRIKDADYLIFEIDLFWKDKRIRISQNGRLSEMYQSFPSRNYDSHIRELQKTCEVRRNLYPGSSMSFAVDQLVECLDDPNKEPLCDAVDGRKALETCLAW